MEQCANCERMIGKLETPYLFQGKVVCQGCHAQLNATAPAPAASPTIGAPAPGAAAGAKSIQLRRRLGMLCKIGLVLWFGPMLLIILLGIITQSDGVMNAAQDFAPLAWLGAILAIGSGIGLFLTR